MSFLPPQPIRIELDDVLNRIPPNINGYLAYISEVKVIQKNYQELLLLTIVGDVNDEFFELTKFLKYELRTGNLLYSLFKGANITPKKGEVLDVNMLVKSIIKIYVEDKIDSEGNTISYINRIVPENRKLQTPVDPAMLAACSQDDDSMSDDEYEDDIEYEGEEEYEDDGENQGNDGESIPVENNTNNSKLEVESTSTNSNPEDEFEPIPLRRNPTLNKPPRLGKPKLPEPKSKK